MSAITRIGSQKALLKTKTFLLSIAAISIQIEFLTPFYTDYRTITQEQNSQTPQIEAKNFVQSHKVNIK